MKGVLNFYLRAFLMAYRKSQRFVRLTPNYKGKIYFFDKKKKKVFFVQSRGSIDSQTANQIYTKHDYNLSFLQRFDEIKSIYNEITANRRKCLIIDCGANIGLSARYFAEEYPNAIVVAIEPDASNCELAAINCNNIDNIVIKQNAIGSSKGFVNIQNGSAYPNSYRTSRQNAAEGIELVTIECILNEYSDFELFLTKIDIEGFEEDLFSSNTDWVKRSPIIIIETHDWMLPKEANSKNFLEVISSENRDFIHKGENIFSISNEI